MSFVYRQVSATYLNVDGSPKSGYIEFTPNVSLVSTSEGIIPISTVSAHLDSTGSLSVLLACTDSPNVLPAGWLWCVEEKVENGNVWWLELKANAMPLDLVNAYNPTVVPPSYAVQGPPGAPGTGGVTDHGALTGLLDDDHTQYAKKDGDTFTGPVVLPSAMPSSNQAARTDWVQQWDASVLSQANSYADGGMTAHVALANPHNQYYPKTGGEMTGKLSLTAADPNVSLVEGYRTGPVTPTGSTDIVCYYYRDSSAGTYKRAFWLNECGHPRWQQSKPTEVGVKIIGAVGGALANIVEVMDDGGTYILRIGQLGKTTIYKGLDVNSTTINNVATPVALTDAANKDYVDSTFLTPTAGDARYLRLTGGTTAGSITVNTADARLNLKDPTPTNSAYFAHQSNGHGYLGLRSAAGVDTDYVSLRSTGAVLMRTTLDVGNQRVVNVPTPVALTDAANKDYVDSRIWSGNQAAYDAIVTKDPTVLYVVI